MELTKQDIEIAGGLRRLTRNRFLLRSKNEKWFQTIIDHRGKLQSIFDSFLIQMDINEALGVAYLRPISTEVEDILSYQIGRKQNLSALASVLIFHLRDLRLQFFLNPGSYEAPLVSLAELRDFAQNFNQSSIDREFERLFQKSLSELIELQVLQETQSQTDLFEITAVCEILLPAEQIQEMKIKMENFVQGATIATAGDNNA